MMLRGRVPLVVTPTWLREQLNAVVVYDASWNKLFPNRKDGQAEWLDEHIPGARFFDLDDVADKTTALPHNLCTPQQFEEKMNCDGVRNDSHVVVYDSTGIHGAARLFWTFKAFGHGAVSVLNGGLPAWKNLNFPLHTRANPLTVPKQTAYKACYQPNLVRAFEDMEAIVRGHGPYAASQVIDARAAARFDGTAPEPRPIPSGHIPGALNVPWQTCLAPDGHLLEADALKAVFAKAGVDVNRPSVLMCGSGLTACVVYLSLLSAGSAENDLSVYDGSWAEWAVRSKAIVPPPSQQSHWKGSAS